LKDEFSQVIMRAVFFVHIPPARYEDRSLYLGEIAIFGKGHEAAS
jgi:hypothetical protein